MIQHSRLIGRYLRRSRHLATPASLFRGLQRRNSAPRRITRVQLCANRFSAGVILQVGERQRPRPGRGVRIVAGALVAEKAVVGVGELHARKRGGEAEWIWNLAEQHFPGAIQVVDLCHARQHLEEPGAQAPSESTSGAESLDESAPKTMARQRKIEKLVASLRSIPS